MRLRSLGLWICSQRLAAQHVKMALYPRILHGRLLSLTPISTNDGHNALLRRCQVAEYARFWHEASNCVFSQP